MITFVAFSVLAVAQPEDMPAPDVILALPGRADRVAVNVAFRDQPLAAAWDAAFATLFANLDDDGNGVLSQQEAVRVPSSLRVRQLSWGYFFAQQPAPVPWAELAGSADAKGITLDRLKAYYRANGTGGLYVAWGRSSNAVPLTDALLKRLDTNGDGQVSEAEWNAAEAALTPHDLNRDGAITPDELLPGITYATQSNALLTADRSPDAPVHFAPELGKDSLTFRFGRDEGSAIIWSNVADFIEPTALTSSGRTHPIRFGDTKLFVGRAITTLPAEAAAAWATARQRFADADADKDGSLSLAEAKASPYPPLRNQFVAADANRDGILTRHEWDVWLDVLAGLTKATVVLSVVDDGAGLFELLDTDRDGQLGPRELRTAYARLSDAGCIVDGRFDRTKLPRHMTWAVGRGRPAFPLPPPTRTGPKWFLAMDRNNDGDVSRAEFLGGDDDFKKLDTDGDGLISAAEADNAPPRENKP